VEEEGKMKEQDVERKLEAFGTGRTNNVSEVSV
jgi:hypothetical protein